VFLPAGCVQSINPFRRDDSCYPGFVEKTAQQVPPARPLAPLSFEELALQQGVAPVDDFEALIGNPSSGDESVEEFSAMLRAWRREGTGIRDPQ
jgi:hypothetical protein